jgi:hypothetical protein
MDAGAPLCNTELFSVPPVGTDEPEKGEPYRKAGDGE